MRCRARPMVALARQPWPRQLLLALTSAACLAAPLTTTSGVQGCVVAMTPTGLNSSATTARRAAPTIAKAAGLHPAITALAASDRPAGTTPEGGTAPTVGPQRPAAAR